MKDLKKIILAQDLEYKELEDGTLMIQKKERAPFALELGKDYVSEDGRTIVIDRKGDRWNNGFHTKRSIESRRCFSTSIICSKPSYWKEATEEQVIEAFEEELIARYGEDWRNVKIKECMYFGECDSINTSAYNCYIKKDIDNIDGWIVWNKNGCLYNNGKWAEVLEEENQYVPFEEEDKEQFRDKWIRRKDGNLEMKITRFETLSTNTFLIERRSPKQLLEDFTFIDGTPFGKIKQ